MTLSTIVLVGGKVFHRLTCLNINCGKIFFRSEWQVARGQGKFHSKACRYSLPDYNEESFSHRKTVKCEVCGKKHNRAPSADASLHPYCSEFCRKLGQSASRAINQLLYAPDLLREMSFHDGPNCAFPGCDQIQYLCRHPQFRNPFHACQEHHKAINNALKQRAKKRRKLMRKHDLLTTEPGKGALCNKD